MALTARAVLNAKPTTKRQRLWDEKSMYLEVTPSGGKLWRLKYRINDKEKHIPLGRYPDVSLEEARTARDAARKMIAQGVDPAAERKAKKAALKTASNNTFEGVARAWFAKIKDNLVPEYADKIIRSLEKDIFPQLGTRPINEIRPPEVLAVLRKIEARGALETLKRVRQRCCDIFTFAIAAGLREAENPLTGLEKVLKVAKVKHRASIPDKSLPEFFLRLDASRIGLPVKRAIRLSVLTFLRPAEIRGARWEEIDFKNKSWLVPGQRDRSRKLLGMKMRRPHLVPLSKQALAIFKELQKYSGDGELVFPNRSDHSRSISDGTINNALKAIGYSGEQLTGAGFRTTAASALAEIGFRKEVIDCQLSHQEKDQVLAAYVHQAEYKTERRKLMQKWADHIDQLVQKSTFANVSTLN